MDNLIYKKDLTDKNYIYHNNNLSFQLPPAGNSPPSIDNFINLYLSYKLKTKNLDLNSQMYKEYNKKD